MTNTLTQMARVVDKTDSSQFDSDRVLFIDCETSTHNKGHPFDRRNKLVSYSYSFGGDSPSFKYYTDPDFVSCLRDCLSSARLVVGFNIKFDLHWFNNVDCFVTVEAKVWDCMLAEYIYTGQQSGFKSLNETLESYGLPTKKDIVKEYWEQGISTEDVPYAIVEEYNNWDVETTRMLYQTQLKLLSERQQKLAYLSGADLLTLQAAEYAGIKFDMEEASRVLEDNRRIVDDCTKFLSSFLPTFPDGFVFNWDSGDHLSAFLYGGTLTYNHADPEERIYKSGPHKGETYIRNKWTEFKIVFPELYKPLDGTEVAKTKDKDVATRFYQTDEPTLLQLKAKTPNLRKLLEVLKDRSAHTKIIEMCQSVLNKIEQMNWNDNYIHGQFNQVAVITGRLSSSGPNLQNTPPEIDKLLVSRYAN